MVYLIQESSFLDLTLTVKQRILMQVEYLRTEKASIIAVT